MQVFDGTANIAAEVGEDVALVSKPIDKTSNPDASRALFNKGRALIAAHRCYSAGESSGAFW